MAIDTFANDTGPDGDPIQFVGAGNPGPSNGTVIVSPSGLIRYTPKSGIRLRSRLARTDHRELREDRSLNAITSGELTAGLRYQTKFR